MSICGGRISRKKSKDPYILSEFISSDLEESQKSLYLLQNAVPRQIEILESTYVHVHTRLLRN